MPWFPVDDTFHSHPKRLATSPAALGLWVVAGSWSSAHLTDGRVPDHVLPLLLADSATLADELVSTGLWRRTRGGYVFKDWLTWGSKRSAKEVQELRRKRAEAGRAGGLASGNTRRKQGSKHEANTKQVLEPPALPSHISGSAVTDPARASPARGAKPGFSRQNDTLDGAAARHPSATPAAEAIARATDPEGRRHA